MVGHMRHEKRQGYLHHPTLQSPEFLHMLEGSPWVFLDMPRCLAWQRFQMHLVNSHWDKTLQPLHPMDGVMLPSSDSGKDSFTTWVAKRLRMTCLQSPWLCNIVTLLTMTLQASAEKSAHEKRLWSIFKSDHPHVWSFLSWLVDHESDEFELKNGKGIYFQVYGWIYI